MLTPVKPSAGFHPSHAAQANPEIHTYSLQTLQNHRNITKLKQGVHHLTHFHQTFPEALILSVSCEHLHAREHARTRSISESILPGKKGVKNVSQTSLVFTCF